MPTSEPGTPAPSLSVSIADVRTVETHTEYLVVTSYQELNGGSSSGEHTVAAPPAAADASGTGAGFPVTLRVWRRYRDFDQLRQRNEQDHIEPPRGAKFPGKRLWGNLNPDVVASRRVELQVWLRAVVEQQVREQQVRNRRLTMGNHSSSSLSPRQGVRSLNASLLNFLGIGDATPASPAPLQSYPSASSTANASGLSGSVGGTAAAQFSAGSSTSNLASGTSPPTVAGVLSSGVASHQPSPRPQLPCDSTSQAVRDLVGRYVQNLIHLGSAKAQLHTLTYQQQVEAQYAQLRKNNGDSQQQQQQNVAESSTPSFKQTPKALEPPAPPTSIVG